MGRADAHLSPPEECFLGQQRTPVPVLCAFAVLLEETGGTMSDVLGNEIALLAGLVAGTEHCGGVLASEAASHNWFLHAIRSPFESERLLLPRLADAMRGGDTAFVVEHAAGDEALLRDAVDFDDLPNMGVDEDGARLGGDPHAAARASLEKLFRIDVDSAPRDSTHAEELPDERPHEGGAGDGGDLE